MNALKQWWDRFGEKHPGAATWIRQGGLFLIFSWLVTIIKVLLLMFLPAFYHLFVGDIEWLWPNIPATILGVDLNLAIVGNSLATGGLAFTLANLTTIIFGECINFPLQRNVTFQSHGPVLKQLAIHFSATILVFFLANLFTCIWNPVTNVLIADEGFRITIQSIVTTFVTAGICMVIIFAVDKTIFSPHWGRKEE